MHIDTTFLERCIEALSSALGKLNGQKEQDIDYDIYRSACIKEFEIIVEQAGKLTKKAIKPFMPSARAVDQLTYKDIFRQALKVGLVTDDEAERWHGYRDNRNNTAHDYGVFFAEETLVLLPQFVLDARSLVITLNQKGNAAEG